MSLLVASLAIVLFLSGFTAAQNSVANCSLSWEWSFNSIGQDPCEVAGYLGSTCTPGSSTLVPLPAANYYYPGPNAGGSSNLCACSTAGYSLISACGGCQGGEWITWSDFTKNCTTTMPPSSFPYPIPSGTRVPHWALLDVTNGNDWDFNNSHVAGDSPEIGPGTILSPTGPSGPSSSASKAAASNTGYTATPMPVGGHSTSAGAIAGGIVGGIAAISILIAAMLFYRRRASATPAGDGVSGSHMDQIQWVASGQETATTLPGTTTSLMKPYVHACTPPIPLARVHVFSPSFYTFRTRMTQLRSQATREC